MNKLRVGVSPITNTIFAGSILKRGGIWAANKQDVTMDALVAVAQHAARFGRPIEIRDASTGKLQYRITVEDFMVQP